MFDVGLDIHLRRIAICVLNETGQVVRRAHVRTTREMPEILEGLSDRFEACCEASCGKAMIARYQGVRWASC